MLSIIERIESSGGIVNVKDNEELSVAHDAFSMLRSYPLVSGECTARERKTAWNYC